MKILFRLTPVLLIAAFVPVTNAQIFYNNPLPSRFFAAFTSTDEIADDTPFSGTQHVGSFSFEYFNQNAGPVNATARFYTVGLTGGVGNLIAAVPINGLAPGTFQFTAVSLFPEQQFDWVATPGLYGLPAVTGGFFSIQFDAPNCGWYESEGPASLNGFYDLSTGQFITFSDDTNASFFLQVSHSTTFPGLAINLLTPTIKGGQADLGTITIYPPRPTVTSVRLMSSRPGIAHVSAAVTIPANTTTTSFAVTTKAVTANTPVTIQVQAGAAKKVAKLTVTAH